MSALEDARSRSASATLRGDELRVSYNFIMAMTEFLDGVYLRVPARR